MPVFFWRSEPARSTKFNVPTLFYENEKRKKKKKGKSANKLNVIGLIKNKSNNNNNNNKKNIIRKETYRKLSCPSAVISEVSIRSVKMECDLEDPKNIKRKVDDIENWFFFVKGRSKGEIISSKTS